MKSLEQRRAKHLRTQGWSVRAIATELSCAKSSVSTWVRDIPLTVEQIAALASNRDRGRATASEHPNSPKHVWRKFRQDIMEIARKEIPEICPEKMLLVTGAALYWAEGYKQSRSMVNVSNADPAMISLMMRFFREVCHVPEGKFRGSLHIHPHLDARTAERFWSKLTGIPLVQFHATQLGVSRASQGKRDTLPQGTFHIVVCDVRLKSRIDGWIGGIREWAVARANSSAG